MSKFARTAAIVVGAVALTVATAGTFAPVATGTFLSSLGIAATASTVATTLGVASAVLSFAGGAAAPPKGTVGGNPTKFTINKESGYPYIIGKTAPFGWVEWRASS